MARIPYKTMVKSRDDVSKECDDLNDVVDIFLAKKPGYHPHDTALRIQVARRNMNISAADLRKKFVVIKNENFKEEVLDSVG